MTFEEIKQAIENNDRVFFSEYHVEVLKDNLGNYNLYNIKLDKYIPLGEMLETADNLFFINRK